jgi:predicted glycogen debranching enzyme
LTLPQFHEQASQILRRFAAFEKNGTVPNMICGSNDSNRDTSDAPLYLIIAVKDYIEASGRYDFLESRCGSRNMEDVLHSIVFHYRNGTPNGIIADPESGLIFSPSHFSWMDTNYPAGTPREGYPIEIQALWYAALKFLKFDSEAEKVSQSIEKLFFRDGKISDCLHCKCGTPASAAEPDDHIRCNMLTALTFGAVKDNSIRHNILRAAAKLIVPGAIRTLADQKVEYPLPIEYNGVLLNDPHYPYRGHYRGAEDTERKAAYHNGTAWCWPFPSYCEALYLTGGEAVRARALSLLLSCADQFENGVIGEMPEVMDGDAPHRSGGCPAQAWSVSEFYRVFDILKSE